MPATTAAAVDEVNLLRRLLIDSNASRGRLQASNDKLKKLVDTVEKKFDNVQKDHDVTRARYDELLDEAASHVELVDLLRKQVAILLRQLKQERSRSRNGEENVNVNVKEDGKEDGKEDMDEDTDSTVSYSMSSVASPAPASAPTSPISSNPQPSSPSSDSLVHNDIPTTPNTLPNNKRKRVEDGDMGSRRTCVATVEDESESLKRERKRPRMHDEEKVPARGTIDQKPILQIVQDFAPTR